MDNKQQFINQSLINQIAKLSYDIAERDAIIAEQQQKLDDKEIKKMDEEA